MVICLLFALSAAILGGCKARTVTIATATVLEPRIQAAMTTSIRIGPRTSPDLVTEVERYLQRYQPGPTPRLFQTTHIYDRHGVLLAELFESGRRTWINFDQVSEHLINATVATEDASFFVNNGIDPARIAGAALQNLRNGEIASGASTITMQLARNLFLGVEQRFDASLSRKFLEAGLAQELTALYTKPELLTMYLNLLNYSNQAYGPEAAAQLYFGKSASELTLAEATLLAGIPQQPAGLRLAPGYGARLCLEGSGPGHACHACAGQGAPAGRDCAGPEGRRRGLRDGHAQRQAGQRRHEGQGRGREGRHHQRQDQGGRLHGRQRLQVLSLLQTH